MLDSSADLVQTATVVVTAISTSGFVAAWFNRKSRRERAADLEFRAGEIDKIQTDAASVALTMLRDELTAAQEDMEKRRAVLVAQEEIIEKQAKELQETKRILASHEATIHGMIEWCTWVTTTLAMQGIEIPPPMQKLIEALECP
jgi:hypothetical protein